MPSTRARSSGTVAGAGTPTSSCASSGPAPSGPGATSPPTPSSRSASRRRRSSSCACTPTGCRPCRGRRRSSVHVVTGDGAMHPHRLADYGAYYRAVKRRFEERVFGDDDRPETYPDPVEHCSVCRWWSACTDQRRDDDHLCRVAGISRLQTKRLVGASVPTLTALATLPPGQPVPEVGRPDALEAARAGAPAAGAVPRRARALRAHPSRPRGAGPGTGRPAGAVARRRLPRLRVRRVGPRGRPRVPDRNGRRRGRRARLLHPLGPRPGRGEAGLREPHRHDHGTPRRAPGHARLPLRGLRGRGDQDGSWAATPRGRTRWTASCAAASSSTSSRSSARACASRRSRTRSRRSRSSTCRSGRARRPAPASPSSSTRSGWSTRTAGDPGRPRRLQQGRLRLDLDDADLARGAAEGGGGDVRGRARPAEGRGRRAHARSSPRSSRRHAGGSRLSRRTSPRTTPRGRRTSRRAGSSPSSSTGTAARPSPSGGSTSR